jgi:hypothetical protein
MEQLITPSNIMFAIGIIGLLFTIWEKVKAPQTKSEQTDALMAQQLLYEKTAVESRFKTMQENFQGLLLQNNNHIHTLDTKIDGVCASLNDLSKQVVKLQTIIEERYK